MNEKLNAQYFHMIARLNHGSTKKNVDNMLKIFVFGCEVWISRKI